MKQKLTRVQLSLDKKTRNKLDEEVKRQRKPRYSPSINRSSVVRDLVANHL